MRLFGIGLALLLPAALGATELGDRATAVLKEHCFACHGAALKMSNLDLTSREAILAGGERGAALVPNYPDQSRLFRYVTHRENPAMPPGKKLTEEEVGVLERWILAGAPMGEPSQADLDAAAALAKLEEHPVTEEERRFWSYQPVGRPAPPKVKSPAWVRNPVDAFILARLEEQGLKPSPPASRRVLARRAYLDLTGLPPGPEEMNEFLADTAPDAFEKLVERLLASPHYGERWGRYWLDLVRFADSGGYERDFDRPDAWRYRDYVVRSFNDDKPYDRFLIEQIAGDELAPGSADAMIATGFLRLGPENNIKDERTRMDDLDDIVSTTTLAFMGMTVGCARCHNHKFDAIPQKDYYRMQTVFFSTKEVAHPLVSSEEVARYEEEVKRIEGLAKPLKYEQAAIEKPYRDRLREERIEALADYIKVALRTPPKERTEGQRLNARQVEATLRIEKDEVLAVMTAEDRARHEEIEGRIEAIEKQRPKKYPTAIAIGEHSREPLPSYFLHRGDPGSKGSVMKPGVLTVASRGEIDFAPLPDGIPSSGRRLAFARWLADPEHPLTARVMANRVWQFHFGEGIVRTASNFGTTGRAPSHPELLDWLARQFVENGWSVKHLHRLIVTSSAYRMGSDDISANQEMDHDNQYFWRQSRRRLQAEIIRDLILATAGTLDRTAGGPAVFPYIDPALFQSSTSRTWPGKAEDDASTWRRSLYVFTKRSIRYPLFEAFDQPNTIRSCDRRNRSTTAPQALLLMNNAFVRLQADRFAERLRREAGDSLQAQVSRAFEIALSRPPSDFERTEVARFLEEGGPETLADFCQTLFNLNEFVYIQ